MATLVDNGLPTLINVINMLKPDGTVEINFADTLTKLKPMLADIPFKMGNLETGDRVSSIKALPSPTWRRINQGTASSKSQGTQYDETCGVLTARPQVDVDLAELSGNVSQFRMNENKRHLEAVSQEAARAFLYESIFASPEKLHGLTARYPATTGYTSSGYVLKSGTPASSNCQSIWIVSWDVERICGIFPKNTVGGLRYEDKDKQKAFDANGNPFDVYESLYKWFVGLEVKDYRYAVRLQWDPSDSAQTDSDKTLFLSLNNALGTVRELTGSTRIYWSRLSRNKVYNQLASNNLDYLKYINNDRAGLGLQGGLLEQYLGITARIEETLVNETAIS